MNKTTNPPTRTAASRSAHLVARASAASAGRPAARGRLALSLAAVAAAALIHGPAWAQSPGTGPGAADVDEDTAPAAADPAPTPEPAASEVDSGAAGADATPSANLRLRRLEQRVQALKERAWRTKARMRMLEEKVLGGGVGANATIVHVDDMGSSYRLVQLVYNLDGAQVFARKDDRGVLSEGEDLEILAGPVSPGSHTVTVLAVYEGRGYGVFKYMNKYKFTVRSSHTFTASEGKRTRVEALAFERGNVTTPVEQRPAIDFKISYGNGSGTAGPSDAAADPPAKPAK